jgi:NADPH-dependent 2,4-dienoyl-CoA reductase/sulfur reductase-like enzyme
MREILADFAIAGGGPAAIAAACSASSRGESVVVIDRQAEPGGQIWRGQRNEWLARFERSGVRWMGQAEIFDAERGFRLKALTPDGPVTVRSGKVLIATGARELFLPFPGWTLPRVFGAGGLQALVKSGLRVQGMRVVVCGSGPLLAAVASALINAGAHVLCVAEQASRDQVNPFARFLAKRPGKWMQAAELGLQVGARYRFGVWPIEATGSTGVEAVLLSNGERIRVDSLACGFGLVPNIELAQLLGCRLSSGGFIEVDRNQQTSVPGVFAAGEVCGIGGVDLAIAEGSTAGGIPVKADGEFRGTLAESFRLRPELRSLPRPETIVCRCEDVPWARLANFDGWREAKLQTRCGMGPCQGRVCGPALGFLKGWPSHESRAPVSPVPLAHLADE